MSSIRNEINIKELEDEDDDIIPEDANESYTLMINLFERGLKNDLL